MDGLLDYFTEEEVDLLERSPYVLGADEHSLEVQDEYYYQLLDLIVGGATFEEALAEVGTPVEVLGERLADWIEASVIRMDVDNVEPPLLIEKFTKAEVDKEMERLIAVRDELKAELEFHKREKALILAEYRAEKKKIERKIAKKLGRNKKRKKRK